MSILPTKFRARLAACEGALLIVDAAQGVEAQTVANVHLAHKQGLTIVPVINKIDLPNADVPSVHRQLEEILAIPAEEAIDASAKMGIGIEEILEAIVHRIPAPKSRRTKSCARWFSIPFSIFIAASSVTCASFPEKWKPARRSS